VHDCQQVAQAQEGLQGTFAVTVQHGLQLGPAVGAEEWGKLLLSYQWCRRIGKSMPGCENTQPPIIGYVRP
jgi:hypothetical protein